MAKPSKRIEQIEKLQAEILALAAEYKSDFEQPSALFPAIDKDLLQAAHSFDMLKDLYKAKARTDKKP